MKITAYLYWNINKYSDGGGKFAVMESDNWESTFPSEYKLLGSAEVEFADVQDFNPRELLLDGLKAEKDSIIKEATRKAEQIEEKIQQLLALPQVAA